MFEDKNKAAEVKRRFILKLCDALCQRNDVARNELADVGPDRLKRVTCFVVATFPVISLIAFLASYASVYTTRTEQGVYIKWSLNCSASSPERAFWQWTLECSHGPIGPLRADEMISGALEDAKNRSFIDGECKADKRTMPDVQSRYLGGFSAHCDLLDAYESDQPERRTTFVLLVAWLVFHVFMARNYPEVYDEYCQNNPGRQGHLF
ncbi:hypothetical protein AAVH_37772, partial [Aphelenchoides avenae]